MDRHEMAFRCPDCRGALRHVGRTSVPGYACDACGGRGTTVAALRKTIEARLLDQLWQAALQHRTPGERACPSCAKRMRCVQVDGAPALDVCPVCHFIWFDAGELELLPTGSGAAEPQPQAQDSAREMALLQLQLQRELAMEGEDVASDTRAVGRFLQWLVRVMWFLLR